MSRGEYFFSGSTGKAFIVQSLHFLMRKRIMLGLAGFIIIFVMLIPFLDLPEKKERDFYYSEDISTFSDTERPERFALETPLSARWLYSFGEHETSDTIEQKLAKSSIVELEVRSYEEAVSSIKKIVSNYNGYVSNTEERDDEGRKYGYIIIRIPRQYFETTIEEIRTLGKVVIAKTTIEDVTEEYVDLEARLKNLEKQEERYIEVLDLAATVDDIIKVEVQLERVRGEIEGLQGKIQYLDSRVTYSIVQVNLKEPRTEKLDIGIGRAFSRAVGAFFSALRAVIIFLGYIIPVVLIFGLIALGGRAIYRRFKEKRG